MQYCRRYVATGLLDGAGTRGGPCTHVNGVLCFAHMQIRCQVPALDAVPPPDADEGSPRRPHGELPASPSARTAALETLVAQSTAQARAAPGVHRERRETCSACSRLSGNLRLSSTVERAKTRLKPWTFLTRATGAEVATLVQQNKLLINALRAEREVVL